MQNIFIIPGMQHGCRAKPLYLPLTVYRPVEINVQKTPNFNHIKHTMITTFCVNRDTGAPGGNSLFLELIFLCNEFIDIHCVVTDKMEMICGIYDFLIFLFMMVLRVALIYIQ